MRLVSFVPSALGRWLFSLLIAVVFALAFVMVLPAGAATIDGEPAKDVVITVEALLIAAVAGIVIPFLVRILSKVHASGELQLFIAALLAALTAVGQWLLEVPGAHTWQQVALIALTAAAAAGGTRVSLTEGMVAKVGAKTKDFGFTKLPGQKSNGRDPDYA